MALSMSIPMELNDALDYCNYADQDYPSDLTDTENDEELYAFTPRAFERTVPRSSKRTYGLFLDSDAVPERRLRSKINEQLELLRAVLPNSCTVSTFLSRSSTCVFFQSIVRAGGER